jgi:hypothetical protein
VAFRLLSQWRYDWWIESPFQQLQSQWRFYC